MLISAIVCILFFLNGCMKRVVAPDLKFIIADRETSSPRGEINSKDGYENLPDGMHGWFEIINF